MSARQSIHCAYRLLSLWRTLTVLASGNPRRIRRLLINRAKAQALYRSGFWR